MADKTYRVNMTNLTVSSEDVPEQWKRFGGRGLTSTIVAQEVKPIWQPGLPISMIASRIFLKSHAHRTMLFGILLTKRLIHSGISEQRLRGSFLKKNGNHKD